MDMRRADSADPDAQWVLAVLDRAQGNMREAFNYSSGQTPAPYHASECYRDKAEIAELAGEWMYAKRWYAESAAAVPLDDTSVIRPLQHERLDPHLGDESMPVWVAFSKYYVTGSLSAYAAIAWERFEESTDPVEREFWAGQVVDVAGILVRKRIDRAVALKVRGLVFAEKEMITRARKDLQRSARYLADEGRSDARVEAELGHLYMLEEKHDQALPYLRRALQLDANQPQAWSDLGLCRIMAEDEEGARTALSKAIELQPDLAAAWYNRGLMHVHAGRWVEAEADLREAARLAPDNPEIGRLLQQVALKQRGK
jgi:tetratricopeptide (TPR) repeat protein